MEPGARAASAGGSAREARDGARGRPGCWALAAATGTPAGPLRRGADAVGEGPPAGPDPDPKPSATPDYDAPTPSPRSSPASGPRPPRGPGSGLQASPGPLPGSPPDPAPTASLSPGPWERPPCMGAVVRGDAEVFVLGAAHDGGPRCLAEVRRCIAELRPDCVVLELDQQRWDSVARRLRRNPGQRYGAETLAAAVAAEEAGALVALGDMSVWDLKQALRATDPASLLDPRKVWPSPEPAAVQF